MIEKTAGNKRLSLLIKAHFKKSKEKFLYKILRNHFIGKPHIISVNGEKIGGITYCSRTARKNLYKLGVPAKEVPAGTSAIESMELYGKTNNYVNEISALPVGTNVLDLFIDSSSEYEHRAAAYINGGNWYVLDPYTKSKSNKKNPNFPIPMNEYLLIYKLLGVYAYNV